ncbi:integral peroxisomal membrane peroxin-domain-containing protein, partial [Vararia minispora EC-137]
LFEFVHTVPAPLTAVLVGLGPCFATTRRILQIFSWRSRWEDGWLALAAWWGVCLSIGASLRRRRPRPVLDNVPPLTEVALQAVISDLNVVYSLLPTLPPLPTTPLPNLLRVAAITYVPYILLTHLIPLRVIVAISGTFVLTYRASWALLLRRTLWRSAWIRWSVYRLWSLLSGIPLSAPIHLADLHAMQSSAATTGRLRFLFTVYENQRWWMGLDWTAALLPNERPSWCSTALAPVPPPSAFGLPEPSATFMSDGKGGRVKRTATWAWDEPEWKVVVRREGDAGAGREIRAIPAPREESTAANKLKKLMDSGMSSPQSSTLDHKADAPGLPKMSSVDANKEPREDTHLGADEVTDADGWVYGDNKWEKRSAKGGMGKYTRHRRWTRIAVLTELVEPVEPEGPMGV